MIINMVGGGTDLSAANAVAADVLSGKKFFSSASEDIQTGTLTAAKLVKHANGSTDYTGTAKDWKNITISGLGFKPKIIIFTHLYNASPIISGENNVRGTAGWVAEIDGTLYGCAAYGGSYDSEDTRFGSNIITVTNTSFTVPVYEISTTTKWRFTWHAWGW